MLKGLHTSPGKFMSLIGSIASIEKTIPLGRLHMKSLKWYLKTHWRYPQSLDIPLLVSLVHRDHLQWWTNLSIFEGGLTTPSEAAQSPSIHRCFPKGLGCSLEASNSQWSMKSGRVKAPHNILELKARLISLKWFRNWQLNQNLLIAVD